MLRRAASVVLLTCLFLTSSQTRMVRAVAASPLEGAWQVSVMVSSANEVYAFTIDGKTLSLTQQRNSRGVTVQNANTVHLTRVE